MSKIPYYRVHAKNGRAYWCPTLRMKALGFMVISLGPDSEEARERANKLNADWQQARKERADELPATRGIRPPSKYVYFIRIGDRIKIGSSGKPFARGRDLTGGAPGKMTTAFIFRGDEADEKRLHRRLASYRTNGEWFVAARPVLLTMTRCAEAGQIVHDGAQPDRGDGRDGDGKFVPKRAPPKSENVNEESNRQKMSRNTENGRSLNA